MTGNSLRLQAQLSTEGTSPIASANFVISGPDGTASLHNVTESVFSGGLVQVDVTELSPGTTYSVQVYATNAAGSGQSSPEQDFKTR